MTGIPIFVFSLVLVPWQDVPEGNPLSKDRTGIKWVVPFASAEAKATKEGRLLMIKPCSDWGFGEALGEDAEVLRAGAFGDERVVRLMNRRFVPFLFDLRSSGDAYDREAEVTIVRLRPKIHKESTAPVLFMTPTGKIVGEVSTYASTESMLRTMLEVLVKHSEYDKPPVTGEPVKSDLERAQVSIDLVDYASARKHLKKHLRRGHDPMAYYLLGHIARFEKDWASMEKHFEKVDDKALADDVHMERAYRLWHARSFDELRRHLLGSRRASNRYTEARYYLGLAEYHLGKARIAKAIWLRTIRDFRPDPWIYRACWAHYQAYMTKKGDRVISSPWTNWKTALGGTGYMGRLNPDLARPKRK